MARLGGKAAIVCSCFCKSLTADAASVFLLASHSSATVESITVSSQSISLSIPRYGRFIICKNRARPFSPAASFRYALMSFTAKCTYLFSVCPLIPYGTPPLSRNGIICCSSLFVRKSTHISRYGITLEKLRRRAARQVYSSSLSAKPLIYTGSVSGIFCRSPAAYIFLAKRFLFCTITLSAALIISSLLL